jgi:hypothetical protein
MKLGLEPKKARFYSGFLYLCMMSVCGAVGAAPCPDGQSEAGEETPGFLRLLSVMSSGQIPAETGGGMIAAGSHAGTIVPASFGLRRH